MTDSIMAHTGDALTALLGTASSLGDLVRQVTELGSMDAVSAEGQTERARMLRNVAQHVTLAAGSLSAQAGRLEAFAVAVTLENEAAAQRALIVKERLEEEARGDVAMFFQEPEGTQPEDWAREAFQQTWGDAWEVYSGVSAEEGWEIYWTAFAKELG